MRRNWLESSVFLLLAFALALTGCGGNGRHQVGKAADSEIKIGGNIELTGGVANLGKQMLNGIQLAIKQTNAEGGVLGKKLVLVLADNKSEAAEAINAATKLITQDKVVAVLGPGSSSNALAAVQVAHEYKIPLLTPAGTNERITTSDGKVRPFAFRACFIDSFQGRVMANFATKSLGAKSAVIYEDSSSDYSKGLASVFAATFVQNGGKILGKEAFLQKDQDFKATLTQIKFLGPDTIFIPAYYEKAGKIVRQAREMGIVIPLLGTDGWDDPQIVEIAGESAMNHTYFSNHYSVQDKDPSVVKFVEAYKREYNIEPGSMAAMGYDAGLMLVDAIKRANSTDPVKIAFALEQTKNLPVSTGIITIDGTHNPVKSAVVIEMKAGKQQFKEKINP